MRRRVHVDPVERRYVFEVVQDVEDILETNKQLAGEAQKSDWGRHTGRIPLVVIHDWLEKEWQRGSNLRYLGPGFNEFLKKKLDDPDNRAWRVDNPSNPFYIGYRKAK